MEYKVGWKEGVLSDFGEVVSGGTPKTKVTEYWGEDISWITPADLSGYSEKYIHKGRKSITHLGLKNSSAKLMPKGSVLFSSRAPIGYVAIAGNELCTNQGFKSLIPNKAVNSDFLYYYFKSIKQLAEKRASGTTFKELSGKAFADLPLCLPPLPEQRAIVSKIEQLFSELDNGISNLKLAQEQLKVYRQAVLKKAFEGDWNTVELQVISNAVGGFAFKSKDFKDGGKYQIIRIGNVQLGNLRLDKSPVFVDNIETKIIDKYLLKQDDVVITLTGTRKKRDYGFTALVNKENLLLNQRIAFLRFNNKCLPKFFLYYSWTEPFKNQFFASETGNVGQGNVGMKAIQSTAIPLLSLPEQQAIVQEIETRLSVCDKIEQDIETNLEKAEALRQSILKKAFEGKLLNEKELAEVRGADDWESAEVLLERIKAERARK